MNVHRHNRAWRFARATAKLIVNNPIPFFLTLFVVLFAATLRWNVAAEEERANSPEAIAQQQKEDERLDDEVSTNLALEIVKNRLRDPDSAKFTAVGVIRKGGTKAVCGTVNAKNGFGGMSGAEPFAVADFHAHLNSMGPEDRAAIKRLC